MNAPARAGAAAALALTLAAPAGADRAAELEQLRVAIEEARERVAAYESEERGLLEAVEALDRSVAMLTREAERARREEAEARQLLSRVEAEAGDLAAKLEVTRRAMRARAVALYKAGEAGAVRLLFASGGVREFLARVQSLRLLLGHDAQLLARHRAQSEALASARERARAAALRSREAAALAAERQGQLASERGVKRQLARRLGADRARERAALTELETAQRALEETLDSLAGEEAEGPPPGEPFASLRGRLPLPVEGSLVEGFGRSVDADYRTESFSKGIRFEAPLGRPVRAVASGRVRYAGWFRGYGRLVVLDHGDDYFTVSGHLSELEVEVGDAVSGGAPVGRVGDTGSLVGPRLYFEIRRGGQPLDPAVWLRALDEARNGG